MPTSITNILPRGLIVSCQALSDEPLHSPYIMAKMALAAKQGGAIAIRANSAIDIATIKKEVDLPIIGIVKRDYPDSQVFITATMNEINELASSGCEIIALDATARQRPNKQTLAQFVHQIRCQFPELFLMADCATFDEGIYAHELGFDLIATTLSGYTKDTRNTPLPNIKLVQKLSSALTTPVISEGGISTPIEANRAYQSGAYAIVVGSAITRPQLITQSFAQSLIVNP
ncbi:MULTISPECIES: N-acetylmannosamine-6-phosphate 2-epimerase [Cysteiniphilum]|uniref:N-acetylmannosamine-6-phosphate 2-epimerase n=1 Tax=Cysteiniphilum TaxID=2056696 RepID=UPI00177F292E|nr:MULTISPECIES: N-acetylmannosamine-6-phosphate 2-epimerase [Cysteiniphilum]